MQPRFLIATIVVACTTVLRGSPADPLAADAVAHRSRGLAALERADYRTARRELETAHDEYARVRDRSGVAQTDLNLARQAEMSSDWAGLRARGTAARDAFHALHDATGEARALRQLTRDPALSPADETRMVDAAIALARGVSDPELLAEMLAERGDKEFGVGNYAAAMADYQPAIAAFDRAGDREQLARALVSLGRVYRAHGEPDRARPLYERALTLEQATGDRQGAIQALNAIAVTDDLLDRHADAMREYERALALARETGAQRLIAFQLGNLGGAYLKGHDYAHAIPILESAVHSKDPFIAAIRRSQLAQAYRESGRPSEARPLDDAAIAAQRASHDEEGLIANLTDRARTYGLLGQTDAALRDVHEALDVLERVRARLVPSDVMKRGFTSLYQDTYGVAIDLLAQRHDAAAALEISERARSRALLDLLASRDLRVPAEPAPAAEIRATAARLNSTIVTYFVTPDATFAWVVTRDRVRLHRLDAGAARLNALVAATRPARAEDAPWLATGNEDCWRELSRLLIDPLRGDLPSRSGSLITIVPHGPLFGLSFAGLRGADGRYLLEEYTIHYAPSIAVLRFTRASAPQRGQAPRYLLVADPSAAGAASAPLPALPGARAEVRAVAGVVSPAVSDVLAGADAAVASVSARMPAATVIHFAAHALVSNTDPLDSYLALAGGRLSVADIYRLHLHADLVTLSACRTALGPLAGDGVAGLTRAFVYAGAASVIATTWDVADAPTTAIVRELYRARANGVGKAAALRQAQLRLLDDLRAGRLKINEPDGPITLRPDPYFWAGFLLVGEP